MDHQLPNDGLEDFLKKSFEQYTESPPPSVWDGIEQNLPAASPPAYFSLPGWAKAAAAIVFVAGSLLWAQHRIVRHQIGQLNTQVDSLTQTIQLLQKAVVAEQTKNYSAQENTNPTPVPQPQQVYQDGSQAIAGSPHFLDHQAGSDIAQSNATSISATQNPATVIAQDETLHYQAPVNATETGVVSETAKNVATEVKQLAARPLIAPNLLSAQNSNAIVVQASQTIRPLQSNIQWSVGVQTMALRTQEEIEGTQMPDNPFFNKPLDADKEIGNTLSTGLTLAAGISKNWQIQSGLLYKQTSMSATHRPFFRFRDRGHGGGHHGGGGGGGWQDDRDHAFNYDLNTSMGVVSMEIDLRQTDTTQQIEDNEQLDLIVTTEQTTKSLCLPLIAQYEIGRGRLRLHVKGGVLANFLLDSKLNVTNSSSLNGKFSILEGRHISTQSRSFKTSSVDYLAGIGASYDISPKLSIHLDPVISGALTNRVNPDNIEASGQSWGLSAGLVFRL